VGGESEDDRRMIAIGLLFVRMLCDLWLLKIQNQSIWRENSLFLEKFVLSHQSRKNTGSGCTAARCRRYYRRSVEGNVTR
jgi:hypothetical protein